MHHMVDGTRKASNVKIKKQNSNPEINLINCYPKTEKQNKFEHEI